MVLKSMPRESRLIILSPIMENGLLPGIGTLELCVTSTHTMLVSYPPMHNKSPKLFPLSNPLSHPESLVTTKPCKRMSPDTITPSSQTSSWTFTLFTLAVKEQHLRHMLQKCKLLEDDLTKSANALTWAYTKHSHIATNMFVSTANPMHMPLSTAPNHLEPNIMPAMHASDHPWFFS